jgi:16S rRNA (uracil1498-N3)-methyltransferase
MIARVLVKPEDLASSRATLDAAAHRHLVKVLRLGAGAAIRVFDGEGWERDACIERVGKSSLEVSLGERRRLLPAPCAITLLQAVPRRDRMDLIVQKTTELGIARIVPVLSQHGMARPPQGRSRRWQVIAEEAARQSGRADVPAVSEPLALEVALAELGNGGEPRYLLWEGERARPLYRALAPGAQRVALLVGPEGGFSSAEIRSCDRAGFESVGLGPRILRTETAAIVAVALTQASAGGLE